MPQNLKHCKATTRNGEPCRNRAVDATGYCRTHHPIPEERRSSGSSFEANCLKVLRLLGYSVELNVTVGGCQIDIFASYQTGVISLRLMVECKDYAVGRNVGVTELKEFAGVLQAARGRAVDKGLMITTQGFTREAKEFGAAAGIELVRFADLATRLVQFDDYVDRVICEFESLPASRYYIELSASETEDYDIEDESQFERPLTDVVSRLLLREGRKKVALLGNFGTGKSTFCRKYAYDLAKRFRSDATSRIPVLVNLSDYESKLDIQELVTNTLQFNYGVRIDLTLCQEL
ncbi:MAG: restriction endonuclease, partial [Phycisphaerales bacterium]